MKNSNATSFISSEALSIKGWFTILILRLKGSKKTIREGVKNLRFEKFPAPSSKKIEKKFNIESLLVDNRMVMMISSKKLGKSGKYIMYIHGGGYVNNITAEMWDLVSEMIRNTGATVVVADYPLAPEAAVSIGLNMVRNVYKMILGKTASTNITIIGDSAGGGLVLVLTQQLKENKEELPASIILLSPWLDVTLTNPGIAAYEKKDPCLDVGALQKLGKIRAGTLDTKNPLVSPIYGSLEGLPKISLFVGGKEIFNPDCQKFKLLMQQKGEPINYYEYPTMFHVWITLTYLKESKAAIKQLASLVNQ